MIIPRASASSGSRPECFALIDRSCCHAVAAHDTSCGPVSEAPASSRRVGWALAHRVLRRKRKRWAEAHPTNETARRCGPFPSHQLRGVVQLQPENLNEPIRVLQLKAPFAVRYSVVYQNV